MSKPLAERMKHLLSTASVNCPVEIPDVEAAAFKVMLSFIYTEELGELNGDNAMAVLYAVKKYNIPTLVNASLQIPISEFRNVFVALAQARLFELEDFANCCLSYIDKNADDLLKSEEFLQIDQKTLCEIFGRDELQIHEEITIWKACRQNGIECSAENRRAVLGPALFEIRFPLLSSEEFAKDIADNRRQMLGPALFKIRFPLFSEDEFSAKIVPSGILTTDEVTDVEQCHINPNFCWISDAYARAQSHSDCIFQCFEAMFLKDEQNSNDTNARKISANSPVVGVPDVEAAAFKIMLSFIYTDDLSELNGDNAMAVLHAVPSGLLTVEELLGIYQFNSNPYLYCCGVPRLYSLKFPSHGRIFNWNKAKGNRRGTLALQIEKVSEFAGEAFESSRFSDAVDIKGLAWKIEAQIKEKKECTDEKCLGFYIWCDAKEGGPLNCVFSATYRIEAENREAENSIWTCCDCVINQSRICRGFTNFITFEDLMDPSNGFYNREEDKLTLTIDVTVKDEKREKLILDQSKSNGTIEMEIEKVSEFAREINRSEHKHWNCKCSGNVRIVSQKNGVLDEFVDLIFDNKKRLRFVDFISFAELMDPNKGFYNREEDTLTLAIDVTVNGVKTEDNS
ncbi:hypothetical protein niasHT_006331 [Heterodera trifolii]|uniref:MATH domain-containing protein n=1 Tax=Heterodera trifolii TaxID=157864 RepID=A0ABD2M4R8_9BILA